MSNVNKNDLRLTHRFVDGELTGAEREAFGRRIENEPALKAACEDLTGLRGVLATGRRVGLATTPAGFTGDILTAVRRQALAGQVREPVSGDGVIASCRRILLVAAAIVATAVLVHTWVITSRAPSDLQAAPNVIEREMKLIDDQIRAAAGAVPAEERRR